MKLEVGMIVGKKILQDNLSANGEHTVSADRGQDKNNYQTLEPVAGHKPAEPVHPAHKAAAHRIVLMYVT
jgi:hypothetical protein